MYGYRRTKEADRGAYYHPLFKENDRDLATQIRRVSKDDESSCIDEPEPISRKRRKPSYNPYAKTYASSGGLIEEDDGDEHDYDAILVLSNRQKQKKIVIDMTTMRVEEQSDNDDGVDDINNETELWHHRKKRVEKAYDTARKEVGIRVGDAYQAVIPPCFSNALDPTELAGMNKVWSAENDESVADWDYDYYLYEFVTLLEEEHMKRPGQVIFAPLPLDFDQTNGHVLTRGAHDVLRHRPCVTISYARLVMLDRYTAEFQVCINGNFVNQESTVYVPPCHTNGPCNSTDDKGEFQLSVPKSDFLYVFDGYEVNTLLLTFVLIRV